VASIEIDAINKVYPNGYHAIHDLSLTVADGEFMVLVGPSGCGKTTALRMVAGLEEISSGSVRIGDKDVTVLPPKDRDIAMVFQNYALYPHMTVGQNIGFALSLRRLPKAEIDQKVRQAAEILGLTEWLDRKPAQLSGGQRQRVAMGRAIVREPAVFLMDEPLSNLDAKLRVHMRAEVSRIQRRLGVGTMYVTHDQTEAMTMGDRVAVLNEGVLQQCDRPQALYDSPNNLFVAGFMGSPAMNLYEAALGADLASLRLGSQTMALPAAVTAERPGLRAYADRNVVVGIRPEDLEVAANGEADGRVLSVDIDLVEALGSELLLHFTIDARRVRASGLDEEQEIGEAAGAGVARADPRVQVKQSERVPLAVHAEGMYFFDPGTGLAITS
jgi:multiple sugar transport system ATP-binding protein